MEAFHGFARWLRSGGDVLADNDLDHQDKLIKLNELMANRVIYNTTLDITDVVNDLVAKHTQVERVDRATISPLRHHPDPPLRRLEARPDPHRRPPCSAGSPCRSTTTDRAPRDDRRHFR